MATVRYGIPSLPHDRRLHSARPAFGADAVRLADTMNHLAGYRFHRLPPAIVECEADTAFSAGVTLGGPALSGLPAGPLATDTVRLVHRVSPQARYLWVAFDYQLNDEGTGAPGITLTVNTLAGVAVDVGVRWTLATGLIGAASNVVIVAPVAAPIYPIQTAATPPRIPTTLELGSATPTLPRLLDVSSAAGSLVEVVFSCVQARICSASPWDWPTGEV